MIEKTENDLLLSFESELNTPTLIAAGPLLMLRNSWDQFYKARRPFIIHLTIQAEDIYQGLSRRRDAQKKILNQENPNFGCWDNDVTTALESGKYVDLPAEKALENIRRHLNGVTVKYKQFEDHVFDAMALRHDDEQKKILLT